MPVADSRPHALLVRHGSTTWSQSGQHTGRTDIPLDTAGEAQARALGERLAGRSFSLALSSPLKRAEQTAALARLAAVVLDPDLMEWDYGEFDGRTTDEIRQEYPGWTIWDGPWPTGETIYDVAARADRVVARVRAEPLGSTVVLVAHGHLLRVLAARWLGVPPDTGRFFVLRTGTVSELGWEHETATIDQWNA